MDEEPIKIIAKKYVKKWYFLFISLSTLLALYWIFTISLNFSIGIIIYIIWILSWLYFTLWAPFLLTLYISLAFYIKNWSQWILLYLKSIGTLIVIYSVFWLTFPIFWWGSWWMAFYELTLNTFVWYLPLSIIFLSISFTIFAKSNKELLENENITSNFYWNKNISITLLILLISASILMFSNNFRGQLAIKLNNANLCPSNDKLLTAFWIGKYTFPRRCFIDLALKNNDKEVCEIMKTKWLFYPRCYTELRGKNNDLAYCNYITDLSDYTRCIWFWIQYSSYPKQIAQFCKWWLLDGDTIKECIHNFYHSIDNDRRVQLTQHLFYEYKKKTTQETREIDETF